MFEFLYEWIQNLAFYMVLVTAVIQVLPNQTYKKYIRFFTGMILTLLLMTPVFQLFHMEESAATLFHGADYQRTVEEIERTTEYLTDIDLQNTGKGEKKAAEKSGIEVEEIQIGR